MSELRDPYEVLQVAPSADETVVRAAYRALAHRYHPDVAGPDGESRMRELNAAWQIIGDPERRAVYDLERATTSIELPGPATCDEASVRNGPGSAACDETAVRPVPDAGVAARTTQPSSAPPWTGRAGPPPGRPSGSVLDFGVYFGWSLGEIARYDGGYLDWLEKKPEGRRYTAEIDALLRKRGLRGVRTADSPARRR